MKNIQIIFPKKCTHQLALESHFQDYTDPLEPLAKNVCPTGPPCETLLIKA